MPTIMLSLCLLQENSVLGHTLITHTEERPSPLRGGPSRHPCILPPSMCAYNKQNCIIRLTLFFFPKICLSIFWVWVLCLYVCLCTMCVPSALRGSGTQVTDGPEPPCRHRELDLGPLDQQTVFSTIKPSLQSCMLIFKRNYAYVCFSHCQRKYMQVPGRSQRIRFPGAGATGHCELLHMGAGNQPQVH